MYRRRCAGLPVPGRRFRHATPRGSRTVPVQRPSARAGPHSRRSTLAWCVWAGRTGPWHRVERRLVRSRRSQGVQAWPPHALSTPSVSSPPRPNAAAPRRDWSHASLVSWVRYESRGGCGGAPARVPLGLPRTCRKGPPNPRRTARARFRRAVHALGSRRTEGARLGRTCHEPGSWVRIPFVEVGTGPRNAFNEPRGQPIPKCHQSEGLGSSD